MMKSSSNSTYAPGESQESISPSAPPHHDVICDENGGEQPSTSLPVAEVIQDELIPVQVIHQKQPPVSITDSATEDTTSIASDESAAATSTFQTTTRTGHKMDVKTILQLRREMKVVFGWKSDYGKLTNTKDGRKNRFIAEAKADRFIRNCCYTVGGDVAMFDKVFAEFERVRNDFGWKEDFGKLTSTAKAAKKREEAERKAEDVLANMSF
mmetsp:Transcript_36947/g.66456  ORF Transcript_36947/g.66456 Transcript_36947/m.66456 type:complete len:211 (+) Transcript_36947:231-863(+)|eukprot:CAMPEP_0201876502 /NCGR_PEP_ID=MMETSP0902-20130614/8175_1 /ASSEMBLY_ACC=CAM_ASM_000551 /TAXON_ID=420261 /ORGANISM="Thalassiosira antarctica, Strain CCMP982" /LENGTH=210 /DNA_ID=CAMNT_0048403759 /DNA_START=204 /DNA_END=836 /DNA_ORIENTATION=+